MTRALAQDLAKIPESEGAKFANPSLQLVRWSQWGTDWSLSDDTVQSRDLDAMIVFDTDSDIRPLLQASLDKTRARSQERALSLHEYGYEIRGLHMVCSGRVMRRVGDAQPGYVGLSLHRSLGVPYLPASVIRLLLRTAADQNEEYSWPEGTADTPEQRAELIAKWYGRVDQEASTGGEVIVFDALPVQVPVVERRKSDLRWDVANGLDPEEPAMTPSELRRRQALCVTPDTEFEFWLAGKNADELEHVIRHLEVGLQLLGLYIVEELAPEDEPAEPEVEGVAEDEPQEAAPASAKEPQDTGVAPPTEIPDDVEIITVRVPVVQYLPNNGRVEVMFMPPAGRDSMKAEEQLKAIVMEDSLRKRIKKKKQLVQVMVDVEPVGNSWKIRGVHR